MMSDDALHLIDDEPVDVDEGSPWEVLVVDDDPEVHEATRFALRGTRVQGRPLHLTHAYSAREARELLRQSVEPAVVLLDVVMETDQAGLDLVDFIRTACGLRRTRIILRTGQPGYAPELGVVARYDINDYRTKSELTRNRLLTALTAAIRSYEQISTIAENRRGLELIVRAAPRLLRPQPVDTFAGAVLEHLCELIGTPVDGVFCAHAAPPGVEYSPMQVVGACGGLHDVCGEGLATIRDERCRAMLRTALAQRGHLFGEHEAVLHLEGGEDDAAVYASIPGRALTETDRQLLEVFAANITGCFANLRRFEQVNYVAYHDALTGLLNRSGFVRALDGRGSDGPRWVALIDLRGFAELSDGLGQAVGNALLVAVANRLRAQLGADCLLARVGGDVFGACGPAPQVNADTLLALFDEPFPCGEHRLPARVSLGLVELPTGSGQGLVTLSRAGIALNIAKHGRQGHHVVFLPAMEEHMRERLALAQRLREALRAGALEVWFQPQVALGSGKVVGLEALARWQLADAPGGWCSPAVFVPLAESSGLIGALGEFVLDRACAALAGLADVGGRELRIAVNVAMPQLRQAGFAGRVQAIMEQHGVSPRQLEIEITESVALEEPDIVREGLGALRALGTSVAIDDFGTGYSSLAQLRDMPIDVLKLDRSFVQGVVEEQGAAFVETIVRMAQRLGLETVGEGVETTGQADCLRRLGCDVAQGYLFARPMPLAALREWLVHREPGGA